MSDADDRRESLATVDSPEHESPLWVGVYQYYLIAVAILIGLSVVPGLLSYWNVPNILSLSIFVFAFNFARATFYDFVQYFMLVCGAASVVWLVYWIRLDLPRPSEGRGKSWTVARPSPASMFSTFGWKPFIALLGVLVMLLAGMILPYSF